jgi:hypothetical protein
LENQSPEALDQQLQEMNVEMVYRIVFPGYPPFLKRISKGEYPLTEGMRIL